MKNKKDTELEESTRHAFAGQEEIINTRAARRAKNPVVGPDDPQMDTRGT